MEFEFSPRAEELRENLLDFMGTHVYPNEDTYRQQIEESGDRHHHPQIMEELKAEARSRGLWNLFLPNEEWGAGLSVLEYAPLAEITGRSSLIAPEALHCAPPDTGNMEILAEFGTEERQQETAPPRGESTGRSRPTATRDSPTSVSGPPAGEG